MHIRSISSIKQSSSNVGGCQQCIGSNMNCSVTARLSRSRFVRSPLVSILTRNADDRCTTARALISFFSTSDNDEKHSANTVLECPLKFEKLPYSGAEVRVEENRDVMDDEEFLLKLRLSIDYWKSNDFMSAWVHVPASRASLIERLTTGTNAVNDDKTNNEVNRLAFDLHHTNTTTNNIVMKKWLITNSEDKISPFATHQVGCAGFVLNRQNELLLVKEWSGPPSNRIPSQRWKLPGGLLDAGENLGEAACREVMEETGIECEFESILTFWHRTHGLLFGKSDLYYVCMLKPKGSLEINLDPVEISSAQWMSIDEFVQTHDHPLILHVLKEVFDIDTSNESSNVGSSQRLVPSSEIVEGAIYWPSGNAFQTYTSKQR